jgi:fructose-1,6-bisphosphatase/inositol monophosphatase family enzyme
MTFRSWPGSSGAPAGQVDSSSLDPAGPTGLDNRVRAAEAVVREAGPVAADHFAQRKRLSIDRKDAQDLVSEADCACGDLIVAGLARLFPRDGFLGEERGSRIRMRLRSG